MPSYLCECRGPCRRTLDLTHEMYSWLRTFGAVLTPECAARENREHVLAYNASVVVAPTIGPRVRPPRSL